MVAKGCKRKLKIFNKNDKKRDSGGFATFTRDK